MLRGRQWVLFLQFLLVGPILLNNAGCDEVDRLTPTEGPPADSLATVPSDEPVGGTDIIIDATPSMRGFTNSSEYQNLITLGLANAPSQETSLTYYQLTTAISDGIRAIDSKMRAAEPAFYASGNTNLQTAIDSVAPGELTVIITDLFQSNADMNAVSRSIIRHAFANDMALGITAARLPFDGRVYDLPPNSRSFAYKGKRPVYGLVIGAPRAVSNYLENLRRYISSEEYNFLLFSPRIAERSAWAEVRSTDTATNLVQVAPKADTPLRRERTFGIRIRDNNQPARLDAKFSMKVLPDVSPLLDFSAINARTTRVWKYDGEKGGYDQKFQGSNTAEDAFQAQVVRGDSANMLRLETSPQDLRRGRYVFNFIAEVQEWRMPEWVSNWTLPPEQFDAETPDGSKTANLRPFLLNVGASLTDTEKPQVGTFQAYIEKQR